MSANEQFSGELQASRHVVTKIEFQVLVGSPDLK